MKSKSGLNTKRNPVDTTLRNVRAAKLLEQKMKESLLKQIYQIEHRMTALKHRVATLERTVKP